jgi:hypothetical protein
VSRTVLERVGAQVAWGLGLALLGAFAGLVVGLATPAHVDMAGGRAAIRVEVGRSYDDFEFTGLLTGKRAAGRTLLGEPVGVSVQLDLDTSTFLNVDGTFDARVLPAYIQTYSNPEQLAHDLGHAIAVHLLRWVLAGAAAGGFAVLLRRGYVAWRYRQDARLPDGGYLRDAALTYRAPERRIARRAVLAAAVVATLAAVPGSAHQPPHTAPLVPTPLLDRTPLAGAEVGGPLLPAFNAAETYIREYFADTNTYYEQVRAALLDRLDVDPPTLPTGPDVAQIGFVTDRHCNTGMDRVIVTLLRRLDVPTLVSAGDDAFSGTFGFESACTAGLAAASHRASITDVFVGGNHDSPLTLSAESSQGIKVLDGKPVSVDGVTFAGQPDPRTSRYGQGIRPSSPVVRERLLADEGEQIGALACDSDRPLVVVLHDRSAGLTALQNGCGNATLALSGHTHRQFGPEMVPLPDGSTGYAFGSASTGGAPTDRTIEHSFASSLTVGPLNHEASINIVSVDRVSGALLGVTVCRVHPDQTVSFDEQPVAS